MATTQMHASRAPIRRTAGYLKDPRKTTLPDENSLSPPKAVPGGEPETDPKKPALVSGVNCIPQTFEKQVMTTKRRFGKTDRVISFRGHQSFRAGEVTPELCHKIGLKLAREMWEDRFEVLVTTHLDRDHLHNHFCLNSVSFRDGRKYNFNKREKYRMREISDRLCFEYGLSVIREPRHRNSPPYIVHRRTLRRELTLYDIFRGDIQDAFENSSSPQNMERYLRRLGYETDFSGPEWKIRLPPHRYFTNFTTLDRRFTPENLILWMMRRYADREAHVRLPASFTRETEKLLESDRDGILRRYTVFVQLLGIRRFSSDPDYRPNSPFLLDALKYWDAAIKETMHMKNRGIDTMEDLHRDRNAAKEEMNGLVRQRRKLENRMRRADPQTRELLRERKKELTPKIKELRETVRMDDRIEKHSGLFEQTIRLLLENERRERIRQQKLREQRLREEQERSRRSRDLDER